MARIRMSHFSTCQRRPLSSPQPTDCRRPFAVYFPLGRRIHPKNPAVKSRRHKFNPEYRMENRQNLYGIRLLDASWRPRRPEGARQPLSNYVAFSSPPVLPVTPFPDTRQLVPPQCSGLAPGVEKPWFLEARPARGWATTQLSGSRASRAAVSSGAIAAIRRSTSVRYGHTSTQLRRALCTSV